MPQTMKSRSEETREKTSRAEKYIYNPASILHIPDNVKERFENQGMKLRWIRFLNPDGTDDYKNINKRKHDGWIFVEESEVSEMLEGSSVIESGRYAGAVTRGDLALAKIPLGKAIARQEYFENKNNQMMDAVNSQLMQGSNSKTPIYNNSKSTVVRGKNPNFQD